MTLPLPQLSPEHGIEWLNRPGTVGRTWNPIVGCQMVAPGCTHCYAMTMALRIAAAADAAQRKGRALTEKQRAYQSVIKRDSVDNSPLPLWNGRVVTLDSALGEPLSWRKPATVFMSMTDLFHEDVPFEFIDRVMAVMALTPQHTHIVLTKRPERAAEYFTNDKALSGINYRVTLALSEFVGHGKRWAGRGLTAHMRGRDKQFPLPNLWIGCSVSDQKTADAAIPHLLRCPAAVRFVSYEPALGPIKLPLSAPPSGGPCPRDGQAYGSQGLQNHAARSGPGTHDVTPCDSITSALKPLPHRSGIHAPFASSNERDGRDAQRNAAVAGNGRLDWLIVGGESGPGARPFDVAWARSAIKQCRKAGVPVFVKQLGARPYDSPTERRGTGCELIFRDPKGGDMAEWPEDLRVREFPR